MTATGTVSGRVANAATRAYFEHVEVRIAGAASVALTGFTG